MHNVGVELASNVVWFITSLILLGITFRGFRRGSLRLPLLSAMMLTVTLCFILLPIISISDDLLEARQAALPLSGQTWRLASEGLTAGLGELVSVAFCFLLMVFAVLIVRAPRTEMVDVRSFAERLTRSQRLRPPPFAF